MPLLHTRRAVFSPCMQRAGLQELLRGAVLAGRAATRFSCMRALNLGVATLTMPPAAYKRRLRACFMPFMGAQGQGGLGNQAPAIPRHCDRSVKQPQAAIGPAAAPCSNPVRQPAPAPCMPLPPAGAAAKAVCSALLAGTRLPQLRPAAAAARRAAGSRATLAPHRHRSSSSSSSSSSAMGQKSLDSFFKRPASAQGAKDASAAAAAAAGAGDAEPVAGVPPLPPAAGGGSPAAAAEDTHAAQASEQQRMRAAANRNAALAKQVRCGNAVLRPGPRCVPALPPQAGPAGHCV